MYKIRIHTKYGLNRTRRPVNELIPERDILSGIETDIHRPDKGQVAFDPVTGPRVRVMTPSQMGD